MGGVDELIDVPNQLLCDCLCMLYFQYMMVSVSCLARFRPSNRAAADMVPYPPAGLSGSPDQLLPET